MPVDSLKYIADNISKTFSAEGDKISFLTEALTYINDPCAETHSLDTKK